MMRIRKLDRRNGLWSSMDYQAIVTFPLFFDVRSWCWEAWGPGIESEHYNNQHMVWVRWGGHMPTWAWECSKFRGKSISKGKIYLRDEAQRLELQMRWMDGR